MARIFYVYVHKRPADGVIFYVGKGCRGRHKSTKSRSAYWHNTVEKYGGFISEMLATGLTEDEAFALEISTISEIGLENLCNLSIGGDGPTGAVRSEKTRRILSDKAKQQFSNPDFLAEHSRREREKWSSKEKREAQSKIVSAAMSPDEVRQKISTGVKRAWESIAYRKARQDWWKDEEAQKIVSQRMSEAQKKRFSNPDEAIKHKQRQESLSKPVFCITNQTTYKSQNEAAKALGISQGGISQCVNGACKTYKGYQFR